MRECRIPYEEWEDAFIREHHITTDFRTIAERLGRSVKGVRNRAARIGCSRSFTQHRFTKKDDEYILANAGKSLKAVAEHIGANYSEVGKRARTLGIKSWKRPNGENLLDTRGYAVRKFRNKGTPIYEHRYVAERMLGRELTASERVHHIDCDKQNNAETNLYVCQSPAEHAKIHHSIRKSGVADESELQELLSVGRIIFDRSEGVYKCGQKA